VAPPATADTREPDSAAADQSGGSSLLARIAAVVAVVAAVALLAFLLFGGGGAYEAKAVFQNAGQLVKGNQVLVGGQPMGTVTDIRLTDEGHAQITMELKEFHPLHEGTTATIRASSLSGIANRYVSLDLGPNDAEELPSGTTIEADNTTSIVDLDQLFNTLDPKTLNGLRQVIRGSARWYDGRARETDRASYYFNPALSTSSRLTRELVRDRVVFRQFVGDTADVMTALAERRDDLSGLVGNANATATAIASENAALARSLDILPETLRNANTTFVNLRATLGDLDVLVAESKPATRELAPLLRELRPLVRDARPTIKDLRLLIRKPGDGNDLIELNRQMPELAAQTDVVFPRTVRALRQAQPVIEYIRPYVPDLTGWFTKFGQGAAPYDANGHYARIQPLFNAFQSDSTPGGQLLTFTGDSSRLGGFQTRRSQRCPGGAMQPPPDGSAPYRETADFECDPGTVPPGP
jgi:phospholipid/cholesterol/gamma-HCH transport system substrate-binding protein